MRNTGVHLFEQFIMNDPQQLSALDGQITRRRRVVLVGEEHKLHDKSIVFLDTIFQDLKSVRRVLFAEERPSTRSLKELMLTDGFYEQIADWGWLYCPFDDPQFAGTKPTSAQEYLCQHNTREPYMRTQLKSQLERDVELIVVLCGFIHVPLLASLFDPSELLYAASPESEGYRHDKYVLFDNESLALAHNLAIDEPGKATVVSMYELRVQRWQALEALQICTDPALIVEFCKMLELELLSSRYFERLKRRPGMRLRAQHHSPCS